MRYLITALLFFVFILQINAYADGSRLVVGDIIAVAVDGEQEFSKTYQINNAGMITLPMVEPVSIINLNTSDTAGVITKALTKVLLNPQVTVAFVERAKMRVFVVGQVQKTGLQEIGVGDKVLQALAQAGYDDTADLSRVNIRRGNEIISIDLTKYLLAQDLNSNVELFSGDTIVVPRNDMIGTITVLGQVAKVGPVPLKRGMTFRELMGLIGGVTVEADTEKVTIKRETQTELISIDYKRAMDGDPTADIALQPQDTVYVPQIETAFFSIMGGVNRPGQYPIKGRLALSEAIALAGGAIPQVGDLRKIQLMHAIGPDAKSGQTINVDLTRVLKDSSQEPLIQRGDVINVTVHKEKLNLFQILQSISPFAWLMR